MFIDTTKRLLPALLLVLCACAGGNQTAGEGDMAADADEIRNITTEPEIQSPALNTGPTAVARLEPTQGRDAEGLVWISATERADGGVRIEADIDNVAAARHGFHIHEFGDCSAPDASSAGGHYAPQGSPHGAQTDPASERHMGDMGNIDANPEGYAEYDRLDPVIELEGPNSVIGRSVIVHEMPDDLESQPGGDAGPRIACGVIEEVTNNDLETYSETRGEDAQAQDE